MNPAHKPSALLETASGAALKLAGRPKRAKQIAEALTFMCCILNSGDAYSSSSVSAELAVLCIVPVCMLEAAGRRRKQVNVETAAGGRVQALATLVMQARSVKAQKRLGE
jgi:hypothetical protein